MNWPWEELGFPGPVGLSLIRRAYAELLKQARPEEKPEEFQRLHNAYQAACRIARRNEGGENESLKQPGADTLEEERASREEDEIISSQKEWDFERLFAEEEAEERGKRFQKLRELRMKNRLRYDAWQPPPTSDPAEAALNWIAVSRALALLEELTLSGAEVSLWRLFCKSELFQYVRNNPDFVFALEDFIRECPEISEAGRRVLRHAYELDTPPIRKEYRALHQLLGGAGSLAFEKGKESRQSVSGISSIWKSFALLLLSLLVLLMNYCADSLMIGDVRGEQVRVWMEEDFGQEFILVRKSNGRNSFLMLDALEEISFQAQWDGPRDLERGRRGYVTDYAEAKVMEEIAAFAESQNWLISPLLEGHNVRLSIPLTGAGEEISTLGNLLTALKQKDWYQELPPKYALYLCWGDWSFYEYDAPTGEFDSSAIRWYYEQFFGPDLCRIALEETGVAASDMGASHLLFPQGGSMTLDNRRFFHVAGTGMPPEKALFHYFLSEDGAELFCVPADKKLSELTLENLHRMDERQYEVKGFPAKLRIFQKASESE